MYFYIKNKLIIVFVWWEHSLHTEIILRNRSWTNIYISDFFFFFYCVNSRVLNGFTLFLSVILLVILCYCFLLSFYSFSPFWAAVVWNWLHLTIVLQGDIQGRTMQWQAGSFCTLDVEVTPVPACRNRSILKLPPSSLFKEVAWITRQKLVSIQRFILLVCLRPSPSKYFTLTG